MRKRAISILLVLAIIFGILPLSISDRASAAGGLIAQTADFVHRSDGVWLWPLKDASGYRAFYNSFTDWAGCHGTDNCPFHNINHGDKDAEHTEARGNHNGHNGIDIGAAYGTTVCAMADGTAYCEYNKYRGNYVVIEHRIGTDSTGQSWSYYSYYQHLSSISVTNGATVTAGAEIGKVGNSGVGTSTHFHLGLVLGISGKGVNGVGIDQSGIWVLNSGFKEGRINNNPAFNSPCGFPTGYSSTLPNLRLHAGSVMYTDDPTQVSIGEKDYLAECNSKYHEVFGVYEEIKLKEDYVPWSLPCNSDTAQKYGYSSERKKAFSLKSGAKVKATKIIKNTEGNYWYEVELDNNGTKGYVFAERADFVNYLSPVLEGNTFPEKITGSTWLSGTINSHGSNIVSVQAYVLQGNTTSISNKTSVVSKKVSVNSTSYGLYNSGVDTTLPFQNLSTYGTNKYYTLVYQVVSTQYRLEVKSGKHSISDPVSKTDTILARYFLFGSTPPPSYTVTFNGNGGVISGNSSVSIESGKTIGSFPNVSLSGYIFDGWYTAATGGTPVTEDTTVSGNRTVYAHWIHEGAKLSFDLAGGSFVRLSDAEASSYKYKDYETGKEYTFDNYSAFLAAQKYGMDYKRYNELPVPARDGYVFNGWYAESMRVVYDSGFGGRFLRAQ